MNHPTQEQWMDYLYGEMKSPEKKSLESHLQSCAPCQQKQQEFQGTMQSLEAWPVTAPERHRLTLQWQPALKWAAAAALLVTTGFAAGHFARPQVDVAALQAQISAPLEQKMMEEVQVVSERTLDAIRQKVQADLALKFQEVALRSHQEAALAVKQQVEQLTVRLASVRQEDQRLIYAAIKTMESQMAADQHRMREDLERVAVYADQSFRTAQRQLVQLASHTQTQPETQN